MSDKCNPFPNSQFKGFTFCKADMRTVSFNGGNLPGLKFCAVLKNTTFIDCH
jgi:hypothetical protein